MVWRDDGLIFVFTNGRREGVCTDTYQEGEILSYPAVPPTGLIAPQRGFGKVWVSHANLQRRLGWATEPEQGYTMTWQTVPTSSDLQDTLIASV